MKKMEERKYKVWEVETTDRGKVKVTCAPPMTKKEELKSYPEAIDVKAVTLEKGKRT